jgi:hypothetical protein
MDDGKPDWLQMEVKLKLTVKMCTLEWWGWKLLDSVSFWLK